MRWCLEPPVATMDVVSSGLNVSIGTPQQQQLAPSQRDAMSIDAQIIKDLEGLETYTRDRNHQTQALQIELVSKEKGIVAAREDNKRLRDENSQLHELVKQQTDVARLAREQKIAAEKGYLELKANERKILEEIAAKRRELEMKAHELSEAKREVDSAHKTAEHLQRLCQNKDSEFATSKDNLRQTLEREHHRAIDALKNEHKEELKIQKDKFEETIADITVANFQSMDTAQSKKRDKTRDDLEKESAKPSNNRKSVRFEDESPVIPPPATVAGGKPNRRKRHVSTPDPNSAHKKAKSTTPASPEMTLDGFEALADDREFN